MGCDGTKTKDEKNVNEEDEKISNELDPKDRKDKPQKILKEAIDENEEFLEEDEHCKNNI